MKFELFTTLSRIVLLRSFPHFFSFSVPCTLPSFRLFSEIIFIFCSVPFFFSLAWFRYFITPLPLFSSLAVVVPVHWHWLHHSPFLCQVIAGRHAIVIPSHSLPSTPRPSRVRDAQRDRDEATHEAKRFRERAGSTEEWREKEKRRADG